MYIDVFSFRYIYNYIFNCDCCCQVSKFDSSFDQNTVCQNASKLTLQSSMSISRCVLALTLRGTVKCFPMISHGTTIYFTFLESPHEHETKTHTVLAARYKFDKSGLHACSIFSLSMAYYIFPSFRPFSTFVRSVI